MDDLVIQNTSYQCTIIFLFYLLFLMFILYMLFDLIYHISIENEGKHAYVNKPSQK